MSIIRTKSVFLLLLLAAGAGSCGADPPRQLAAPARPLAAPRPPVAAQLPKPPTAADTAARPSPADQLQPIRANVRRINGIGRWPATVVRSLDEPGEGGEATFYYAHGQLEKVVARHFGEMGQQRATYYLLRGQPSFVLEQAYTYNRPIWYDAASRKQGHDNQEFDFDKSTVEESRSYFAHGQLVQQLSSQGCGAPLAAGYLRQEQARLRADFQAVMRVR